jgi:hypothetical protein
MGESMKSLFAAAAIVAVCASAASAETVWQGDLTITKLVAGASTCQAKGWDVGAFFRTEVKPAGLPGNTADSKFSLIGTRNAQQYQLTGNSLVAGTYDGLGIGGTANRFTWTSKISGVTPSPSLAPAHKAVYLTLTVDTFFGITGCKVKLQGGLGLRSDT